MRWPVSGAAYDDVLRIAEEAIKHAEQLFGELKQRNTDYRDLLDKYHALKIQGAAPEPAPLPAMTPKAPDPVYEAITAAAGADRGLRASMSREAQRYRAMNMPDIEIIRRIQSGESDEELFGAPAESMTH